MALRPVTIASYVNTFLFGFWYSFNDFRDNYLAGCECFKHTTAEESVSHFSVLFFSFCHGKLGGSVAEWLACWTQAQKGLGFKSQPRRCRVTVLGKLFTPILPLFTWQRNSLRVAMVTAGLAESNGSLLFCSLAVLDPMVGHTMDILSPFIPVLCHSD